MQLTGTNKSKFLEKILHILKKYPMLEAGDNLLVGVSGGMDSVSLLHVLNRLKPTLGFRLHVAHFNHNLRGAESLRDARFVEKLACEWGLPYTLGSDSVKDFAQSQKMSLEEAARTLRYRFFYRTAEKVGANKIATAHTADDQAETLLLRLLQGAGLDGLSGIRPMYSHLENITLPLQGGEEEKVSWSGQIIRPFLQITREEIRSFVEQEGLEYVQDSSNLDRRYLRNKIRWDLLPLLKQEFNPNIIKRLAVTADLLRDDLHLLEELTEACDPQVCKMEREGEIRIELPRFARLHPALQKRLLRRSFEKLTGFIQGLKSTHVQAAVELLNSGETGKSVHLPGGVILQQSYGQGIMLKRPPETQKSSSLQSPLLTENPGGASLWGREVALSEEILQVPGIQNQKGLIFRTQVLSVKDRDAQSLFETLHKQSQGLTFPFLFFSQEGNRKEVDFWNNRPDGSKKVQVLQPQKITVFFDYHKLRFPLRVRKRKPGDHFQPLGMKGRKKLQDLLVDLKVPREKRDLVPILEDEEGIIWVTGYRIAERVKVDSTTEKILVCTVTPSEKDDLP
ncbi:MAG TPA: tRNA lysidine(34) synthetase TilS [Candidatus Limnocylindrales bacterium]|nr:tRNA lysidine(34) synthetase TilS [Candidatus Limnocylindrales bacterium]